MPHNSVPLHSPFIYFLMALYWVFLGQSGSHTVFFLSINMASLSPQCPGQDFRHHPCHLFPFPSPPISRHHEGLLNYFLTSLEFFISISLPYSATNYFYIFLGLCSSLIIVLLSLIHQYVLHVVASVLQKQLR